MKRELKLDSIRNEIDRLDEQLVELLARRFKLADEIAALKRKFKLKIRDEARERAIIDRARERARRLGLDPTFVEGLMRLVIAHMTGAEIERVGGTGMWAQVQKPFRDYPAQLAVAKVLFKYGLRVRENGEIACGEIKVPAMQVAKEAGVDRRAVDATTETILENETLRRIFMNLEPIAYLKGVAQTLGLGLIEILPRDATKPGIIHEITEVISRFKVSIRQAVADDPFFVTQPKLTIITDRPTKGKVLEELRKLPSVQSVVVY